MALVMVHVIQEWKKKKKDFGILSFVLQLTDVSGTKCGLSCVHEMTVGRQHPKQVYTGHLNQGPKVNTRTIHNTKKYFQTTHFVCSCTVCVQCLNIRSGLYAFGFFFSDKGQGHWGICSLVKGTLWYLFKGTKAMTWGHGGNRPSLHPKGIMPVRSLGKLVRNIYFPLSMHGMQVHQLMSTK